MGSWGQSRCVGLVPRGTRADRFNPGTRCGPGILAAMARTPDGPPPAPAVQKLRVRYAKRGRLRFSSTRDFQRALERALRRAAVPMAFSAGFHPHPKVSYANAAPTGTASEAEYFEISVTERVDPQRVRAALDEALPQGLDVLEVVEAPPGLPSLADRLQASDWTMEFRGMPVEGLADAAARMLAQERVEVTRVMKNGPRTFDVRGAVVSLVASPSQDGTCAILRLVVRHTTPAVRPDDVLTALHSVAALTPPTPPLVTRLAQGPLRLATATVTDPLVADQDIDGI
jgi:radical SAM-linked protein